MKYYVDCNAAFGPARADGSVEHPFHFINDAAKIAIAGDEVLVAPGIYREYVDPVNGGTEDKPIVYRSVEPLGAVISGAELVSDWKHVQGSCWVSHVDNRIFGDYNPFTTLVYGDWYFAEPNKHTAAVYLNGQALYEAVTLEECLAGQVYECSWKPEESIYKWYAEQDDDRKETIIYANFQDKDPNEETIEINVRRMCFFPSQTGRNYIQVSGFRIEKAATTWAPPAAFQDGMIGPHWSRGWVIEDCDISNSKCSGISLGKYYDPENNHFFTTKYVKSPTQMERDAVCRGQYHGWLKEKIGGHIIRRNNIHHCEQGGIIGRMGGVFSIIEDNHIHHINNMMELGGAEIAGIKIHAAIDVIIRRNHIHNCNMGIWCDWEAQGTRITQNLLHHNQMPEFAKNLAGSMMSQDLFVEVGHGPTLIDNNILLSDASLRFATQGVALVHNLIAGAFTCVGGGTDWRYTPYHIPHRTEVMGFMTILHGDDRIYNNIFLQRWPSEDFVIYSDQGGAPEYENRQAGTHVFDQYPNYEEWISQFDFSHRANMSALQEVHFGKLPVWIDGNVYAGGAKAWKKEKNKCILPGNVINVDDISEAVENFSVELIDTERLGHAFEPDEAFENPDGSPITFDRDYAGACRDSKHVIAGPFARVEELKELLGKFKNDSAFLLRDARHAIA